MGKKKIIFPSEAHRVQFDEFTHDNCHTIWCGKLQPSEKCSWGNLCDCYPDCECPTTDKLKSHIRPASRFRQVNLAREANNEAGVIEDLPYIIERDDGRITFWVNPADHLSVRPHNRADAVTKFLDFTHNVDPVRVEFSYFGNDFQNPRVEDQVGMFLRPKEPHRVKWSVDVRDAQGDVLLQNKYDHVFFWEDPKQAYGHGEWILNPTQMNQRLVCTVQMHDLEPKLKKPVRQADSFWWYP